MKLSHIISVGVIALFYLSNSADAFEDIGLLHRTEKIDDSHLTVLGFTLGKASLEDIQAKLGKAEFLPRKEQAPGKICYVSSSDGTILVITLNYDLYRKEFSGFCFMQKGVDFKESSKCTESSIVSRHISTASGIKLGMNKSQLKKLLGIPTKETNDKLIYRNLWKLKMSKEEIEQLSKVFPPSDVKSYPYFDVLLGVDAVFRDSKMISIEIAKTLTY